VRGLAVAIWATLFLVVSDVARVPALLVEDPGGWIHLGGVVVLGLSLYGLPSVVILVALAVLWRFSKGRQGAAGPLPLLSGVAVTGILIVTALAALADRPLGPDGLTTPWLLDAQIAFLGSCLAGWTAARLVRAAMAKGGRWRMALLAIIPLLPGLLTALPVLASAGLPERGALRATSGGRPDIVLMVADTLRADGLAGQGTAQVSTPFLASLASRGVTFADATAQASWTLPSTATILTGLLPADHGVRGHGGAFDPDARTMARILEERGYETAAIIANPLVSRSAGFHKGFLHWDEEQGSTLLERHGNTYAARIHRGLGGGAGRFKTLKASEVVDRALPILHRQRQAPLFLYLHFMDPHDPYEPPPDLAATTDPGYDGSLVFGPETLYGILRGEIPVSDRDLIHARALYDAEITYMDREIGRLLQAMEPRLREGAALVAFTSDHGEEFMEHGALGHEHTLYQELVHVPLILARPGHLPEGRVVNDPVSHLDLLPTLLSLADLPPVPDLPGRSLLSLHDGEAGDGDPPHAIFSEEDYTGYRAASHEFRSIRSGPSKIILTSPNVFQIGPWKREVFDLATDPGERQSLASLPVSVETLEARLRDHMVRTLSKDPGRQVMDPDTERKLRALGYVE
jgi:arylsulfatase A-like enzyme